MKKRKQWNLFTPITWSRGRPVAHAPDCECKVVHRYKCGVCGRVRGWCLGAHDNMPQACDFCWEVRQPPQLLDEPAERCAQTERTVRAMGTTNVDATDGLGDEEDE